jgi:hypothetical protein
MEPDEIREEIQRRKKRAVDLKLRESLWALYDSHLRWYPEKLKKDPEMVYPEIREALQFSGAKIQFRVGEVRYGVFYKEGLTEGRPNSNFEGMSKTAVTLALEVDEKRVFDFEMKKVVLYTPEMPFFSETMGEVTSFIEGAWVNDVTDLLRNIKAHVRSVGDKQQAPRKQQKLREDMKRFGL